MIVLLALLACRDEAVEPGQIRNIEASVTDVSTVLEVTWETAAATQGFVEFWEEGGEVYTTSTTESATDHSVLLLGMPAATEVHYRVVSGSDESAEQTTTTGALPIWAPNFEAEGELTGSFVFAPQLTDSTILMVDGQGRIVWWHNLEHDSPKMRAYRAWPLLDGSGVVIGLVGADVLRIVPFDGGDFADIPFAGLGHDFLQLPDGNFAGITKDVRVFGGVEITGERIVEVTWDGTMSEVWSVWDSFQPAVDVLLDEQAIADWPHANALDYDAETETFYINLMRLGATVKVNRTLRQAEWILGGELSDFTYGPDTEEPGKRHQFHFVDGAYYVFHNGEPDAHSTVRRYLLDENEMVATLDWSYATTPPVATVVFGDVELLDGDVVHSTWGSAGIIRQITGDSTVAWSLTAPVGSPFGYSVVVDDLYVE